MIYEVFMLQTYVGAASADCGVPVGDFTTVEGFFTAFVEAGCPTIGDFGCSLDGACNCQDNLGGITPYAARPSFYDPDVDLMEYVSDTCMMWDMGTILPTVPQALVLGDPTGPEGATTAAGAPKYDHVKALEYVFYTNSAETMVETVAQRPYDAHTLTVEESQEILHMWQDAFIELVPEKVEVGVYDTAPCTATYATKREAQAQAVNCRNCDGAHDNGDGTWSPCRADQNSPTSETAGYQNNGYATKTFDDIFKGASEGAVPLVMVGLVLIFAYAFFTTGCSFLALGGVTLVVFGLVGGLGCALWMGVSFNGTHINVLPFLMIGLGVDDMFLIIRTLYRFTRDPENSNLSAEEFVARTLVIAGPSVSLTTLANFCAFFVGTLTPIPAVQEFCRACAICTLVMYCTDLLGFSSLCVVALRFFPPKASDSTLLKKGEDSKKDFVRDTVVPFLSKTAVRVTIVLIFAGALVAAVLGMKEIKQGLNLKQITKKGTQVYDFLEVRYEYFAFYPAYMSSRETDFSVLENQRSYLSAVDRILQGRYSEFRVDSWLKQFLDWCNPNVCDLTIDQNPLFSQCGSDYNCQVNSEGLLEGTNAEFMRCLNAWNGAGTITSVPNFYPKSNEGRGGDTIGTPLEYCEFPFYTQGLWTTEDYVDMINDIRDIITDVNEETGLDLYPTGYSFQYWEQYRNLYGHLTFSLCVAILCAFCIGVLAIFIATTGTKACSISAGELFGQIIRAVHGSLIMTIAIVSTMIMLLGFMGYAEIQMSAIPAVTVIACVGICVDLTALVTLFFCQATGTQEERISDALSCVLVPTLDSMTSTIVGCLAMGFSPIELYVLYFFAMYVAVAVIGTLNGLVLLPVLLAWLGPRESRISGTAAVSPKAATKHVELAKV